MYTALVAKKKEKFVLDIHYYTTYREEQSPSSQVQVQETAFSRNTLPY